MNCNESLELLDAQFEQEFWFEPPGLTAHLRRCASCRAAWKSRKLLCEALQAWKCNVPQVDLAHRVVERQLKVAARGPGGCPSSHPGRPASPLPASGRQRLVQVLLAAAALVAVVLMLPPRLLPNRSRTPRDEMAASAPAERQRSDGKPSRTVVLAEPHRPKIARRASVAQGALTKQALGVLGAAASLVMPPSRAPADTSAPWEVPSGLVDGLQEAMAPIGRGLNEALDFLWVAGEAAGES